MCAINQPKMLLLKTPTIFYLFYELSWLLCIVLLFCVSLFGVSHLAILNWQSGWVEGSNKASLTLLGGLSSPGGLFTYLRWVSSQHVGLRDFTWQFTWLLRYRQWKLSVLLIQDTLSLLPHYIYQGKLRPALIWEGHRLLTEKWKAYKEGRNWGWLS